MKKRKLNIFQKLFASIFLYPVYCWGYKGKEFTWFYWMNEVWFGGN